MTVATHARQAQATYSGPTSLPFYCTECTCLVQTVYQTCCPTPKFCPFCGQATLVSDETKHTQDHASALRVSVAVYTVLREDFRAQKAFITFSEYVHCMMHSQKPRSEKDLQAATKERMRHAI